MAVRDASATRARVLDAAVTEFARAGLAGARVDRIAEAASANKRAIYDHFGDKEGLFEAAAAAVAARVVEAVPYTPDDLPGYVGRLVDFHGVHPEPIRLATWRALERPGVDPAADRGVHQAFVAMVGARPGADEDGALPSPDLGVLLLAMASARVLADREFLAVAGSPDDPGRLAAHRAAVVEAVRRVIAAP